MRPYQPPWEHLTMFVYFLNGNWRRLRPVAPISCPNCDHPLSFWLNKHTYAQQGADYAIACEGCDLYMSYTRTQDETKGEAGYSYPKGHLMEQIYRPLYEGFARMSSALFANLDRYVEQRRIFAETWRQRKTPPVATYLANGWQPIANTENYTCPLCEHHLELLKLGNSKQRVICRPCGLDYCAGSHTGPCSSKPAPMTPHERDMVAFGFDHRHLLDLTCPEASYEGRYDE